jgi:DtxR family Mn-dependent transcriptional regulator
MTEDSDGKTAYILTPALEDYLETILELVQQQKVARVRDIARIREVSAGSVTPAMKRLAALGLVRYVQREYIDLTPDGEREARRVHARHRVLTRFFTEVLGMPPKVAESDACKVEHQLSFLGMDHLVRFLEFVQICPEGASFLARFRECTAIRSDELGFHSCLEAQCPHHTASDAIRIGAVTPGSRVRIAQIGGDTAARRELLNRELVPNVVVEVLRIAEDGSVHFLLDGVESALTAEQSRLVFVFPTE